MKNQMKIREQYGSKMSRRDFLGKTAAAAVGLTIVPRHVLGGPGYTAPSEKVNLAMIGTGGQGTHDMTQFLQIPDVQVVAVCDVYKECDYESESLWYHLEGTDGLTCISGKWKDRKLPESTLILTRWRQWKQTHPGTELLDY